VSFDDDSYPVDGDFFRSVAQLFLSYPSAAIFEACVWHRHEAAKPRGEDVVPIPSYIGCGYAIRLAAYRQVRGHIVRPVPYGMEEMDLSMQLFAIGWKIFQARTLRVFHDTELKHHQSAEITSGSIANVALFAFLHYPIVGWGLGLLQMGSKILYLIRMRRSSGICTGLLSVPIDCYRNRHYRKPLRWNTIKNFVYFNRTGRLPF
jgi:hypothetical protein